VALLWVAAAAVRGLVRAWRSTKPGERVELMGAAAALSSAAVHGLFDTVQMMPTLAMLLAIVGAIGLHRSGTSERGRGWQPLSRGLSSLLWVALVVTGFWSLWGYGPAAEGVLAGNLGEWERALTPLDDAVARDPNLALNRFHAGFAHGVLATDDTTHLEPAIANYEAGIALDPEYAPHHANLSSLLWEAGRSEEAISEMKAAQDLAPRSPIFALNLGLYYEESGDLDAAADAYERAAILSEAEAAHFWRVSPLRQAALIRATDELDATEDGFEALRMGELAEAQRIFDEEAARRPNSVLAYRGRAALALAQGDEERGAYYLRVALFIGSTYGPREHLRAQMDWARYLARRGDLEQAISRATPVLDAFRRQGYRGFGRYGTADYGWYLYYRESLAADMLPQVQTAGLPDEVGEWMVEVAGWAKQEGDGELAEALCREALDAIPDSAGARECLDGLAD
jgi:tetratricopeptide (TPR) repeat protein